jgi:hypothetical protein
MRFDFQMPFFFAGATFALGVCNVTAVVKPKPDEYPDVFVTARKALRVLWKNSRA